jgi:hypothetical protein
MQSRKAGRKEARKEEKKEEAAVGDVVSGRKCARFSGPWVRSTSSRGL